ncbi:hypothetical protein N7494_001610 [Penicillium frequentans]|uniref:Xylanolytic transcriptional activator regulatory domain-containing protein n=1 Tax=Penicillium frequentans TaxID=3151616 RepID=A0AAD6D227_9EURO|nr:hypothetical protein N7494_001610 [Penicillium glabrum]
MSSRPTSPADDIGRSHGPTTVATEAPFLEMSRNASSHEFSNISKPLQSALNESETASGPLLLFNYYPCLQVPNLRNLQPADVAFLESQKCFHIPVEPFLETLVAHYFLYVHPCLPIVDEAEFWLAFRQRKPGESKFSLLTFQAMLFVACSYVSLTDARKWGAESIRAVRDSLYRRAKLLYDFGVENDHLCLSQALTLLTFQSTGSDHLINSTWLTLAIQQARAADAHVYHHYPSNGKYKQSVLKRLWWCLVIRDRIIALGMRRPLQILPSHFDTTSHCPLLLEDLSMEIHASEVYDPETKVMLSKVLTSQCRLVTALTTLIMAVYPPDQPKSLRKSFESVQINEIKFQLDYWKANHMLPPSSQDSGCHPSISFYKQLTCVYFETARLALYHLISFQAPQHERQENLPDLMNAVGVINEMVKRFIVDGTAAHLPISVVAYTVLPQLVLSFDLRFCGNGIGRKNQAHDLKIYNELNRQYELRYNVSHVASWVNDIICLFETSISRNTLRTATTVHSRGLQPLHGFSLLQLQPALYFQLTTLVDTSMSTGHLALEGLQSIGTLSATSPKELSSPLETLSGPNLTLSTTPYPFDSYRNKMVPEDVVNIDYYTPEAAGRLETRINEETRAPGSDPFSPDKVHDASRDEEYIQISRRDTASIDLLWGNIGLLGE